MSILFAFPGYEPLAQSIQEQIDITLGVPLSNSGRYDILGYLAFPRLLVKSHNIKIFGGSDSQLDLHGYNNLDMIESVLS